MAALTVEFVPGVLDLYVDQGDDYSRIITLRDGDGELIDLTGFTASATMKKYYGSTVNYPITATVLDATGGQVLITINDVDTALMKYPRFVYNVKLTSGSTIIRILSGQVLVNPQS